GGRQKRCNAGPHRGVLRSDPDPGALWCPTLAKPGGIGRWARPAPRMAHLRRAAAAEAAAAVPDLAPLVRAARLRAHPPGRRPVRAGPGRSRRLQALSAPGPARRAPDVEATAGARNHINVIS